MCPIEIDITGYSTKFGFSLEESELFIDKVLEDIVVNFIGKVENLANSELHSTRNDYINGINVIDVSNHTKAVELKGWMPNALEKGLSAFDEKEGFKKSSNKKIKKGGGWYLTIPFRFATPGSIGESSVFTNKMPEQVYQAIQDKIKKGDDTPLKLSEIPKQYEIPKVRPKVVGFNDKVYDEYKNKGPIYEGIKKTKKDNHIQYASFRRVSDLSDTNSWIHTGISKHDFFGRAITQVEFDKITRNAAAEFIGL